MIITDREKNREIRKMNILRVLVDSENLYTSDIARKIGVLWPTTDKLLQELIEEKQIKGDKVQGYSLYKRTVYDRLKRFLR